MSSRPSETLVRSGAVGITVRDHGGDGTPVLLVHGAGGNLLAWERLAPALTTAHRVLAVDLRGHGRSGDGPWSWAAALDDLDAVVEHFGLSDPAVVGHSLGGMLAGMWARRHPGCPAAVSLDGHRAAATHATNYSGPPAQRVRDDLDRLNALFAAQAEFMAKPMSAELVESMLDQQRAAATRGIDAQLRVDAARRSLTVHDGRTWLRPNSEVTTALRESAEFADALPVFGEIHGPFLVVVATRDFAGLPDEFRELMEAFRAGLRRDLVALTARRPNIRVREIDASHDMVFERPDRLAEIVGAFLGANADFPADPDRPG